MSKATWGDDDGDGVLPWVEDKLDELGAETPGALRRDRRHRLRGRRRHRARRHPRGLLRPHPGGVRHALEDRSRRRVPRGRVGHSLRGHDPLNSAALGLAAEGEQLIDDLDAEIARRRSPPYPELAGKKVLFSFLDPADLSQIGFYTSHDTRPGFLASLGHARRRRSSRRSRPAPTRSTSRSAPKRPTASPTSTSS